MNITAAIVACAILGHGSHVHDPDTARIEAEAFVANVQAHVPLTTLLAVAWVESRFSPTGSARDRASRHMGIFQIFCPENSQIDCESYLDPATNIRRGASLLELRWHQARSTGHPTARAIAAWVAAYYFGSVPATRRRRDVRRYYAYAARVHGAESMFRNRLAICGNAELSELETQ